MNIFWKRVFCARVVYCFFTFLASWFIHFFFYHISNFKKKGKEKKNKKKTKKIKLTASLQDACTAEHRRDILGRPTTVIVETAPRVQNLVSMHRLCSHLKIVFHLYSGDQANEYHDQPVVQPPRCLKNIERKDDIKKKNNVSLI